MLRHYDDFEIVIQPSGERYVIQLLGSPAGEGRGEFALPFTHVELSNFYSRIGQVRRITRRARMLRMWMRRSVWRSVVSLRLYGRTAGAASFEHRPRARARAWAAHTAAAEGSA